MEQEPTNEIQFDISKIDPFKVVLVLGTIVVTCLLILSFYAGALRSCSSIGGTLDVVARCYTPQDIERINKFNEENKRDANGMLPMKNYSLTPYG
jgi:hypothetical protein